MLLEGSELTKEDRELQLYDDFEHFRQNKGETIHDYYVRFVKLINDMRNIKMTIVQNALFAYLKQHEAHANENKMMLDRFTQLTIDPLALMSNVSHQQVDRLEARGTMHGVTRCSWLWGSLEQSWEYKSRVALDEEQLLFIIGGQDNVVDEDVDEQPVQDLALNVDNVFQVDDCDAFDYVLMRLLLHRLCSWQIYHP
ncbi:hypothetical protein Tco_0583094 [Tanacetum coccineum]